MTKPSKRQNAMQAIDSTIAQSENPAPTDAIGGRVLLIENAVSQLTANVNAMLAHLTAQPSAQPVASAPSAPVAIPSANVNHNLAKPLPSPSSPVAVQAHPDNANSTQDLTGFAALKTKKTATGTTQTPFAVPPHLRALFMAKMERKTVGVNVEIVNALTGEIESTKACVCKVNSKAFSTGGHGIYGNVDVILEIDGEIFALSGTLSCQLSKYLGKIDS